MPLTVVCVVDRRRNAICRSLRNAGMTVIETFTTDQAVALCVANRVDAVVLYQEFFVEVDGWSVAQSLKMVKPSMCILLATRAKVVTDKLPKGVDAVVPHDELTGLVEKLQEITGAARKAS